MTYNVFGGTLNPTTTTIVKTCIYEAANYDEHALALRSYPFRLTHNIRSPQ